MSFPVLIQQDNAQFVVTLMGAPEVRAAAATREGALAEMQTVLQDRLSHGEIMMLDVFPKKGILAFAGKYKDDPYLTELCEEAYRQRDAEPKE